MQINFIRSYPEYLSRRKTQGIVQLKGIYELFVGFASTMFK